MKVIRHIKKGNICCVSHIDSMRVLQRTLIRAQISTKMSEGFNPHPITYTSHPLPLGVASEEEFFVVANEDMTTQQVLEAFNNNIPNGMEATHCFDCAKNPNFAKNVNYCEYFVSGNEFFALKKQIEEYLKQDSLVVRFPFKDTEKEQDIAPLILDVNVKNDGIVLVLAAGNPNLRPDRVTDALNEKFALKIGANDIIRTKQLIVKEGKTLTATEFLQEFIK